MSRLDRFTTAQDNVGSGFDVALREIRSGGKQSHWIWYIFPQLAGIGTSARARLFGIDGEDEALEFLRDRTLGPRLLTITRAVAEQVRGGRSVGALMGSAIDAQKLVSSMTLFHHAAGVLRDTGAGDEFEALANAAGEILAVAAAEGYPACGDTLARLGLPPARPGAQSSGG